MNNWREKMKVKLMQVPDQVSNKFAIQISPDLHGANYFTFYPDKNEIQFLIISSSGNLLNRKCPKNSILFDIFKKVINNKLYSTTEIS